MSHSDDMEELSRLAELHRLAWVQWQSTDDHTDWAIAVLARRQYRFMMRFLRLEDPLLAAME